MVSMKAETVFGAAFLVALAFLAYCIFILPAKRLQFSAIDGGLVAIHATATSDAAKK